MNGLEEVIEETEKSASELPQSKKIHEELISIVEEFFYGNVIRNFRNNLSESDIREEYGLIEEDANKIEEEFEELFIECQKAVESEGAEKQIDSRVYQDFKGRLKVVNDNANDLLKELEGAIDYDSCIERISQFKKDIKSRGKEMEVSQFVDEGGGIGVSVGFGESEKGKGSSEEIKLPENLPIISDLSEEKDKKILDPSDFKKEIQETGEFEKVPPFEEYHPSLSMMDKDQKSFFKHWLKKWRQKKPISVEGNISYIFVYVYKVLSLQKEGRLREVVSELARIRRIYSGEEKLCRYLDDWISDTYILMGEFEKALEQLKNQPIRFQEDKYYSLKRHLGLPLEGKEILSRYSTSVLTEYGKANKGKVEEALSQVFREYENDNEVSLIEELTEPSSNAFPIYVGTEQGYNIKVELDYYEFDNMKAEDVISPKERSEEGMIRRAENKMRIEEGEPKVGDGWVSKKKREKAKKKVEEEKIRSEKKKSRIEARKDEKNRR